MKRNKGITLIALVITVIILLILAGVTLYSMNNESIIDKAMLSKFIYNLRTVEEKVELESVEGEMKKIEQQDETIEVLPIKEKLTKEEKEKVPTLAEKIKELNGGNIDEVELYWIDKEKIKVNFLHDYIIDKKTGQVYDYQGEKIGNKVYHIIEQSTKEEENNTEITIKVSPEVGISTKVTIVIDYGKLTVNKYRIGTEEMGIWKEYTGTVDLTSIQAIENNLQNPDHTITIYAKGINAEGKEVTTQKAIHNLDVEMPKSPEILNGTLPTIKLTGVEAPTGKITIVFDQMEGIRNYYSTDNAVTWIEYKGDIEPIDTMMMAKSVKESGLEIISQKMITLISKNVGQEGYDKDENTYSDIFVPGVIFFGRLNIDKKVGKRKINVLADFGYYTGIGFLDKEGNVITTQQTSNAYTFEGGYYYFGAYAGMGKYLAEIQIPENATQLVFLNGATKTSNMYIYDVKVGDEPILIPTTQYMKLYADSSKNEKEIGTEIRIDYLPTSTQKLYRIGENGKWNNYENKIIKIQKGETIYAKAIDSNGRESTIIQYTAVMTDVLSKEVLDKEEETYFNVYPDVRKIKLDSSVRNKTLNILENFGHQSGIGFKDRYGNLIMEEKTNNLHFISGYYYGGNYEGTAGKYRAQIQVPENACEMVFSNGSSYSTYIYLYEIEVTP